jgi:flagellar hook assembly protein FlgD
VSSLFPFSLVGAFSYSNGYHSAGVLAQGQGYWIKIPSDTTVLELGGSITNDTIPVNQGWNLVGSVSTPVSISSTTIQATPARNSVSNFYDYSNGYHIASTIYPWQGYWVKTDTIGTVIEKGTSQYPPKATNPVAAYSSITFSDGKGNAQPLYFTVDDHNEINLAKFEMPPAFASADFDARFASNRILETYPSTLRTPRSFGIAVHSSANAPLTVSWDIVGRSTMSIALQVLEGGKVVKSIEMKRTGSVKGVSSASGSLALVIAGAQIPKEFSLSQNYPNPFNPTTRIDIGLPVAANTNVAVYNILGQKIATLSNGYAEAGMHTFVWNGQDQAGHAVATGVYFVRMSAGSFTATKKMLLMK